MRDEGFVKVINMNIHFKNLSWVYFFTLIGLPLAYFTRLLYANNLSLNDYGIFYGLFGFFGVFEIIRNWGIPNAVNFFANKAIVQKNNDKLKTLFWFAHFLPFVFSVVIIIGLYLCEDFIFQTFYKDEVNIKPIFNVYLFLWLFQSVFTINTSFLAVFQNQKISMFFEFLRNTIIFVLTIIAFSFSSSFLIPVYVYLIAFLVVVSGSFLYLLKKYNLHLVKSKFFLSKKYFQKIFLFASAIVPASFANTIFVTTDTVIIQYFLGAKEVALYATAVATSELLLLLIQPATKIITPLVSKLWHSSKKEEIATLLLTYLAYIFIVVFPVALFFALVSSDFILLFFGEKFERAGLFLFVFSVFAPLKGIRILFNGVLSAIGQPKKISEVTTKVGVFNLLGSLLFIHFFGVLGVIMVTIISFLYIIISFGKEIIKRVHLSFRNISLSRIIFSICLFVLISQLLNIYFSFQLVTNVQINFLLNKIILFMFAGFVYLICLFQMKIVDKDKLIQLKNLLIK